MGWVEPEIRLKQHSENNLLNILKRHHTQPKENETSQLSNLRLVLFPKAANHENLALLSGDSLKLIQLTKCENKENKE